MYDKYHIYRIVGPKTASYATIIQDSCEVLEMQTISNKEKCEEAARALGMHHTTAFARDEYYNRPYGCIYANNYFLQWNPYQGSTKCGSWDQGYYLECICDSSGIN